MSVWVVYHQPLAANLNGGLTGADPGLLRLKQAVKAALLIVSAGLVALGVMAVFSDSRMPDVDSFVSVCCFASILLLVQGPRAQRRRASLVALLSNETAARSRPLPLSALPAWAVTLTLQTTVRRACRLSHPSVPTGC